MAIKSLFTVVPPQSRNAPVRTIFSLHRDRWDDYGFKTQYQLFFHRAGKSTYIGSVKILQKGQGETSTGVLADGPLSSLSTDFCSMGQSLDYYERLAELPDDVRTRVLSALRDVVVRPRLISSFNKEAGWAVSLAREIPAINDFLTLRQGCCQKTIQSFLIKI